MKKKAKKRRKRRGDELRREYDLSKLEGGVQGKYTARNAVASRKPRRAKAVIIKDPITGLPVLSAGKNAPKLTSEQVRELLADFP